MDLCQSNTELARPILCRHGDKNLWLTKVALEREKPRWNRRKGRSSEVTVRPVEICRWKAGLTSTSFLHKYQESLRKRSSREFTYYAPVYFQPFTPAHLLTHIARWTNMMNPLSAGNRFAQKREIIVMIRGNTFSQGYLSMGLLSCWLIEVSIFGQANYWSTGFEIGTRL